MKSTFFLFLLISCATAFAGFPGSFSLDFDATKVANTEALSPSADDSPDMQSQKQESYGMINRFANTTMTFDFQEGGQFRFEIKRDRERRGAGTWTRNGDTITVQADGLDANTSFLVVGDTLHMKIGPQLWFLVLTEQT